MNKLITPITPITSIETNITADIKDYIPHRGKMLLLDKLLQADDEQAIASVRIHSESLFLTDKGVPATVGIEYMAQTVAAYSGVKDQQIGQAPKIGLLLGSRRYDSQTDYFRCGDELHIIVQPVYMEDNSLGVFSCRIECEGKTLVTATLNVLQPERIEDYF